MEEVAKVPKGAPGPEQSFGVRLGEATGLRTETAVGGIRWAS